MKENEKNYGLLLTQILKGWSNKILDDFASFAKDSANAAIIFFILFLKVQVRMLVEAQPYHQNRLLLVQALELLAAHPVAT